MALPTENKYIDYVMSLTPGGMKEGRDNIIKLMKILGNPQDTLRVFHVTGSNGKGSVCQMISQTLWKNLGKKVGLFTSPHLIKINERFQINGVMISDNDLNIYYEKVLGLSKKHTIELTFFEIQVIVMVLYFIDQKVDYAVVEVGLGGLYDGTNIFTHPLACFITSITLEHTHILGKTRSSVLKNKLGIVKPGSKLYTWVHNKQVHEYCRRNKIQLSVPLRKEDGGDLKRAQELITNLPGSHQQKNAQLVLQSLLDLGFKKTDILKGLQKIENTGRFQWLSENILVDTANNEENIKILAKMLRNVLKDKHVTVLFGTTQTDPAYAAQLTQLIPARLRILVDGFCDRTLPSSEYIHLVKHDGVLDLSSKKGAEEVKTLLEKGNKKSDITIIFGSLYLVGEIMKLSIYHPFANR